MLLLRAVVVWAVLCSKTLAGADNSQLARGSADWGKGPVWVYSKGDGSRTVGEVEYFLEEGRPTGTLVFSNITSKQVAAYRLPNSYAVVVLTDTKDAVLVRLFAQRGPGRGIGVCRMKFADGNVWSSRPGCETIPYAGDGLDNLKEIQNLPGLNLAETQVTREVLERLRKLANLQWLNLSGTEVNDEDLLLLVDLKQLRHLHLSKTCVTARGVKQLTELVPELQVEFRGPSE